MAVFKPYATIYYKDRVRVRKQINNQIGNSTNTGKIKKITRKLKQIQIREANKENKREKHLACAIAMLCNGSV